MRVLGAFLGVLLLAGSVHAAEMQIVKYTAVVNDDGVQVVEMEGGDYFFRPNHIVVKAGVPVELRIKRVSFLVPHDIVMDQPDAGMQFRVDFGKKGEAVRFTPARVGTYPFYCDKKLLFFKAHRERGMEGIIEVVE